MARSLSLSATQKRLLKVIAAGVVALVAFITTIGQPEERHEDIVRDVCDRPGLEQLAEFGGLTEEGGLCTHGPDPLKAFAAPAALPATSVNLYYRQGNMCPGDGVSGERVYIYVGAPADRPAVDAAFVKRVKQTLGLAERQLRLSHLTHAQKINFYCATDRTPTIHKVTWPAVGSDGRFTFGDTFGDSVLPVAPDGAHIAFVANITGNEYPYCGQGSIRVDDTRDRHMSLIAPFCLAPSDTFLHELGHNLGAVATAAPNDSGAWHCHDLNDVMCYNDGGSYFAGGGQMITRCSKIPFAASDGRTYQLDRFDCNHDDYWSPASPLGWIQASTSPLLTPPRRK